MSPAAAELLVTLRGQGFSLAPEGGRIRIAPAGRLTAELRELIRRHKAELLAALAPAKRPAALGAPAVGDAGLLRLIEADLGLPAGSLRWIDPPRGRDL